MIKEIDEVNEQIKKLQIEVEYLKKLLEDEPHKRNDVNRAHKSDRRKKRATKRIGLIAFCSFIFFIGLKEFLNRKIVVIEGNTLGTQYHIQYRDLFGRNYKREIDNLLHDIEQTISNDVDYSELSRFNKHKNCEEFYIKSLHLASIMTQSKLVYYSTNYFDPTILPLYEFWQNEKLGKNFDNPRSIAEIMQYIGFEYIVVNEDRIKKLKEGVMVDLRGITKGYAADSVAKCLKSHGIENMLIDIGGKIVSIGLNAKKSKWCLDINTENVFNGIKDIEVKISNKALAIVKGFCDIDSKIYSKSCFINPFDGELAKDIPMLVMVFAPDCAIANAYATAIMVGGVNIIEKLSSEHKEIGIFVVQSYDHENKSIKYCSFNGISVTKHNKHYSIDLNEI